MTPPKRHPNQSEFLKKKDTATTDGKLADKSVKFCPHCRRCYDTRYTKMSVILAKSFIMTTFPHTERKEGPVRDANNTKQRNVPRLSEYDDVGHC